MLTKDQAREKLSEVFSSQFIREGIDYHDLFVFMVITDDELEGDQDPYFSVNKNTGEVRDFSIFTDGDPNEIIDLFAEEQKTL